MAGGIGSFFIQKGAGMLFTYSGDTNMQFMGFEGKPAGYAIVFYLLRCRLPDRLDRDEDAGS